MLDDKNEKLYWGGFSYSNVANWMYYWEKYSLVWTEITEPLWECIQWDYVFGNPQKIQTLFP